MTKPFFVCEADIRRNAKLAALPNDSARYGWVAGVLGAAKLLRPSGRFQSRAHFKEALDRFARYLPAYLSARLMEQAPDLCDRCAKVWGDLPAGVLVVHDWHKHQRDPGSAERAKEWRENDERTDPERLLDEKRTRGDTDLSRALSRVLVKSPSSSSPEGGPGGTAPPAAGNDVFGIVHLVEELTNRSWSFSQGNRVIENLRYDVRNFGPAKVEAAVRAAAAAGEVHDPNVLAMDAHKALNPMSRSNGAAPKKPKGMSISDQEADRAFDND